MALIKCLGCGQLISDKALTCPKCGRANIIEETTNNNSDNKVVCPKGYKSYAFLGIAFEAYCLVSNLQVELDSINLGFIVLNIFGLIACTLLLYKNLKGLYLARIFIPLNLLILFYDLYIYSTSEIAYDYLIQIALYAWLLIYWMKKVHFEYLNS